LSTEEKIVVFFDMCSSSTILEDLLATNNKGALRDVLIETKDYLRARAVEHDFIFYKFIGDGWILLFPPAVGGVALVSFLTGLSQYFSAQLKKRVLPRLQQTPKVLGLTFGVDKGPLVCLEMLEQTEYIGRGLNVASRLQGAIKNKDKNPAYKVLFSKHSFKDLRIPKGIYKVDSVTRELRNIQGGKRLEFMKLTLPM